MQAQRLLEAEAKRDDLQHRLSELTAQHDALQQAKDAAELAASRVSQPTSYLVNKLREEEGARLQLSARCDRLAEELRALQREKAACAEENLQLRERLVALLQQRAELQAVRTLLTRIQSLNHKQAQREQEQESSGSSSNSGSSESELESEPEPERGRRELLVPSDSPSVAAQDAAREADSRQVTAPPSSPSVPIRAAMQGSPGLDPGPSPEPGANPGPHPGVSEGGKGSEGDPKALAPSLVPLSLEAAARVLNLSPQVLREMTSPPKSSPVHNPAML